MIKRKRSLINNPKKEGKIKKVWDFKMAKMREKLGRRRAHKKTKRKKGKIML